MATGDMKNNVRKLLSELKKVSFDCQAIDYDALVHGIPSAFLPIMHHVFLDYSHDLASYFSNKNYELYASTDLRFMESIYKILMQEFSYKPNLTKEQFLALGFAERKIILLTKLVQFCREKNASICAARRKKSLNRIKSSNGSRKISHKSSTHVTDSTEGNGIEKDKLCCKNSPPEKECEIGNTTDDALMTGKDLVTLSGRGMQTMQNEKVNGLPLPNLGPVYWSNKLNGTNEIPKPCDLLTVTPMKDVTKGQINAVDSVFQRSKADVIEVENIIPQSFKVINHNAKINAKKVQNPGSQRSDEDTTGIMEEVCHSKTSSENVCIGNCAENTKLLASFQDEFKLLQQSVKELVVMNNELSARVVLLETHNKLMEQRIEGMEITLIEHSGQEEQRVERNQIRKVKNSCKAHKKDDKQLNEYSPDNYTDYENTLPHDFTPIKITNTSSADEGKDNIMVDASISGDDDGNDWNYEGENDDGNNKANDDCKDITLSTGNNEEFSNENEIHSPLHQDEFSFMEENTRNAVKNLQKKLEETMNMFARK